MTRIVGIHGIWSQGDYLDKLGAVMKKSYGYEYLACDYEYNRLYHQWSKKKRLKNAEQVAQCLINGDVPIAHSNGAGILHEAMKLLPKTTLGPVILVAPAFSAKARWPENSTFIHVIHNVHDVALTMGSVLPFSEFGPMGLTGADVKQQPNYFVNHNHDEDGTEDRWNHSHYFHGNRIHVTAGYCHGLIKHG